MSKAGSMFVIQILRLLPASDYKLDLSVVLCAQSESSGCLNELFCVFGLCFFRGAFLFSFNQ